MIRIDIPRSKAWISVSEYCRAALPFQDSAVIVQAYMGLPHALYEATHGLAHLFSHKKTIVVLGPIEPIVDQVLIGFSEEGYTIKHLSDEEAGDPSAAWLAPILSDLIFVLFSVDDPVTGRFYDRRIINETLKDKRVFRVSLNHSPRFLSSSMSRPMPFEVRLLSATDELTVVVAGERFRVSPSIAPQLPWRTNREPLDLSLVEAAELEDFKARVLEFEQNLPAGFKAYFKSGDDSRIFDRAVIYHEEIDGFALAETLAEATGRKIELAGCANVFESTSPCRWNDPRFLDWLLQRGESENVVRGLLLIDPNVIDLNFREVLSNAASSLLKIQNG